MRGGGGRGVGGWGGGGGVGGGGVGAEGEVGVLVDFGEGFGVEGILPFPDLTAIDSSRLVLLWIIYGIRFQFREKQLIRPRLCA